MWWLIVQGRDQWLACSGLFWKYLWEIVRILFSKTIWLSTVQRICLHMKRSVSLKSSVKSWYEVLEEHVVQWEKQLTHQRQLVGINWAVVFGCMPCHKKKTAWIIRQMKGYVCALCDGSAKNRHKEESARKTPWRKILKKHSVPARPSPLRSVSG